MTNCYLTGTVLPRNSTTRVGAFAGWIYSDNVSNYFYDMTTSKYAVVVQEGSSSGITGQYTTNMIQGATFGSWGVKNNTGGAARGNGTASSPWYIDENVTYPYFYYQFDGQSKAAVNYSLGAVTYLDGAPFGQKSQISPYVAQFHSK